MSEPTATLPGGSPPPRRVVLRHPQGGHVLTYSQTDGQTDVPSTTYSDAAASFSAGTVVAEYVGTRLEAGLSTTVRERAIMGRYARELIRDTRWDQDHILEAVHTFATSRRHPRFLAEWVASVFNAQTEREYEAVKAEAAVGDVIAPNVLAAIMRGAGT